MVVPLTDLCLLAVRKGVVNGQYRTVHHLSPEIRYALFDSMRRQQMLNNKNCLRCFRHPRFLDGFDSIDMVPYSDGKSSEFQIDQDYYKSVGFLSFLSEHLSNYPNLARHITSLNLMLCRQSDADGMAGMMGQTSRHYESFRFRSICNLIGCCPRLVRLSLDCFSSGKDDLWETSVIDYLYDAVRRSGSFGLIELRLIRMHSRREFEHESAQLFVTLLSLSLDNVRLPWGSWLKILHTGKDRLRSLRLNNFDIFADSHCLLPVKMNSLTSLKIEQDVRRFNVSDIVVHCPQLTTGYFRIVCYDLTESDQDLLAEFTDKTTVVLTVKGIPLNLSRMLTILGERIVELRLSHFDLTERITDHVLAHCRNLTSLRLRMDDDCSEEFLVSILTDKVSAVRLRQITLKRLSSRTVLDLLFANCLHLTRLQLQFDQDDDDDDDDDDNNNDDDHRFNRLLTDDHLIGWLRNGARPSSIFLKGSSIAFTDRGLIALLHSCGSKLKELAVKGWKPVDAYSIFIILMDNCPMVELFSVENVSTIIRSNPELTSRRFYSRVRTWWY